MEDLKHYLKEYKRCTLNLINCVEKDDIDNLQKYFDERQDLISDIEDIKYTKKDFSLLCNEFDIIFFEKKLSSLMMQKEKKLKNDIRNLKAVKGADKNYKKKYDVDSIFFNKKI